MYENVFLAHSKELFSLTFTFTHNIAIAAEYSIRIQRTMIRIERWGPKNVFFFKIRISGLKSTLQ